VQSYLKNTSTGRDNKMLVLTSEQIKKVAYFYKALENFQTFPANMEIRTLEHYNKCQLRSELLILINFSDIHHVGDMIKENLILYQ
jgi:hypothetical protein